MSAHLTGSDNSPSFVVGVGASAGGLEAIERMVDKMPVDTGMAFVIIQHLSPDFKSLMDELLARWTTIPIHRAEDGMQVERNSIYLLPPKKEMVISGGRLLLTDKDPKVALTLPIDHFFRSLAQDCGRRSIAVVLSGTGSDGSRGVVDVHHAGGLVIVQREDTAKFDGMPRAARASGAADLFAAPEEIPDALVKYLENPRFVDLASSLEGDPLDDSGLRQVFTMIRDAYGLDFSNYKINTIVRRTERRMTLNQTLHIDEYVERLKSDRAELDHLYRDLLIGVTHFFRDKEAYELLEKHAIEPLVGNANEGEEIRVWVAGTATGEEAYSVAILFDEAMGRLGKRVPVKIFATDVHRGSLERAGHGVYPEDSFHEMASERLAKYFRPVAGGFQVATQLRQMIVFAPHNLIKDAPFTKINLITCRNLLIYLHQSAQKKILSLLHFGLKTGGLLLLGPSESPGDVSDEFDVVDGHWKLFRKRRDVMLAPEVRLQISPNSRPLRLSGLPAVGVPAGMLGETLMMSTYDAVLAEVMPPSLLVSEDGLLLHTFGNARDFLRVDSGRFHANVVDWLHPDLKVPVSTAVRNALKQAHSVSYSGVRVARGNNDVISCNVAVRPITDERNHARLLLIQIEPARARGATGGSSTPIDASVLSSEQISALEADLRYTKENLQATIEEMETSNEELQATNQELVASNEELQSTNEELHSVNEELYTVNAEHQNKISQLSELTRDMDNLLQSTEVHTVFLDRDLRIRKFTPQIAETFNIVPQDIGRRIDSFTNSIECENLSLKLSEVIVSRQPYEEEVRDGAGRWFLMRLLPYHASGQRASDQESIDGALLTLVDISKLKQAADDLQESVKQRDRFLAMLSHELRNPLATIVNATQVLSRPDGRSGGGALEIIQRQSQHMSTLLDDLLDVTRVSQGKIQLHKRTFDLLGVVRSALEGVQGRCAARGQSLSSDLPVNPVWIRGSEPRILQVLSNLLTNASKYSPQGGAIWLKVTRDDDNRRSCISVRDNGVGIAPDQIDRVFDLFVQSDRTLDRSDGGLGVGLTLVKSLVELHDGQVEVTSEGEGRGCEFSVTFPLSDPPVQAAGQANAPPPERQSKKVVLIEDNIDASKMLAFLLEDAGYEVTIASDGAKGLEAIVNVRPDAAIIDVGLPEMTGYDVVRTLRLQQDVADTFCIALTGYSQEADRTEALAAGFSEHLVKPVDPELLIRLLNQRPASSAVH